MKRFLAVLSFLVLFVGVAVRPAVSQVVPTSNLHVVALPSFDPAEQVVLDMTNVVGYVQSTGSPESYTESWQWATGSEPDAWAVTKASMSVPSFPYETTLDVEDHAAADGCGASVPTPPKGAESWAVYNLDPQGTLVLKGARLVEQTGAEHWYLSPDFDYPGQEVVMVVARDAGAKVLPEYTHYISAK